MALQAFFSIKGSRPGQFKGEAKEAQRAASPQGIAACASNEVLPEVVFEFMRANPAGKEYVYQTIKLTNPAIIGVSRYTGEPGAAAPGIGPAPSGNAPQLEERALTFRSIEVSDADGRTMAADYVDKILKGEFAGDLPIEQPTAIELVANLKAAKAMGLALPPAFLSGADDLIE